MYMITRIKYDCYLMGSTDTWIFQFFNKIIANTFVKYERSKRISLYPPPSESNGKESMYAQDGFRRSISIPSALRTTTSNSIP